MRLGRRRSEPDAATVEQQPVEEVPAWKAQGFAVDPNLTAEGRNDEEQAAWLADEAEARGFGKGAP